MSTCSCRGAARSCYGCVTAQTDTGPGRKGQPRLINRLSRVAHGPNPLGALTGIIGAKLLNSAGKSNHSFEISCLPDRKEARTTEICQDSRNQQPTIALLRLTLVKELLGRLIQPPQRALSQTNPIRQVQCSALP